MRKKLIFLCSVLLFGSCFQVKSIKPEEDQKLMISRIEEFHRLYNEQRFEEIAHTLYEPDFLQARGKDEIIGDLEHIYRKCGKVINAEFSSRPTIYSGGERETGHGLSYSEPILKKELIIEKHCCLLLTPKCI